MSTDPNDILGMLDRFEEALAEDAFVPQKPAETRPPPRRIAPALSAERPTHPDPPPRSSGPITRVSGSTSNVLASFKWGP